MKEKGIKCLKINEFYNYIIVYIYIYMPNINIKSTIVIVFITIVVIAIIYFIYKLLYNPDVPSPITASVVGEEFSGDKIIITFDNNKRIIYNIDNAPLHDINNGLYIILREGILKSVELPTTNKDSYIMDFSASTIVLLDVSKYDFDNPDKMKISKIIIKKRNNKKTFYILN